MKHSYYESSARERVDGILDTGSFREILPPTERVVSPHLEALDLPTAFDDGVVIGRARSTGNPYSSRRRKATSWVAPWVKCRARNLLACWKRPSR
jgi:hypothetical protein